MREMRRFVNPVRNAKSNIEFRPQNFRLVREIERVNTGEVLGWVVWLMHRR